MDEMEQPVDEKRQQKLRNDANNAKTVQMAAAIAAKSDEPIAKAIGTAIQETDKYTGGAASKTLGKVLTKSNNSPIRNGIMTPPGALSGKKMQKLSNKLAESGTADRITDAVNKGKIPNSVKPGTAQSPNATGQANAKINNPISNPLESTKQKTEEESSDGGGQNLRVSKKVIKLVLIATPAVLLIMVICCVFMSASQVYYKSVGLGHADALSDEEVEEKINKKQEKPEELDEEINENDVGYDFFIDSSSAFKNSKLQSTNFIKVAHRRRKYTASSLDELEDFYPGISNLGEEYDERLVYDFFLKMYNLYTYYEDEQKFPKDKYNSAPLIDLPLLMATLTVESNDMEEVFAANLEKADRDIYEREQPVADYAYDKDWSSYRISRNNSVHDMEILAQHMVSKQAKEACKDSSGKEVSTNLLRDDEIGTQVLQCKDGETYSVSGEYYGFDDEKYREFLKEFLEKKYFINTEEGSSVSDNDPAFEKYAIDTKETPEIIKTFIKWLVMTAEDDTHGYDQAHRNGPDYDCSSLVYYGLVNSGFSTDVIGTTAFRTQGGEREALTRAGFKAYKNTELGVYNGKSENLKPGDILWKPGHTEVYIGNGMVVGGRGREYDHKAIAQYQGDQTGEEIAIAPYKSFNFNWEYIYRYGG